MSAKTVAEKLLFKPGMRIAVVNAPDGYERLVGGLPKDAVRVARPSAACDAIHLFVATRAELQKHIEAMDAAIGPDTLVWLSYPLRTSKLVKTDLTRDIGWDVATVRGLDVVSQVAVGDGWSALRFRRRAATDERVPITVSRTSATAVRIDAKRGTAAFDTTIESLLVRVPSGVYAFFGGKGRVPVVGTIQGARFQSTLARMGGVPCLAVKGAVRAAAKVSLGDTVTISLARHAAERVVDVPPALTAALAKNPTARAFFASLAYTHRKEYAQWIAEAKREETRMARVAKTLERLVGKRKTRS